MIVTIEILRHGENRLYCSEAASFTSQTGGNSELVTWLGYCTRVLGVPGGSPYSERGLWASSGGNCVVEEFLDEPSSANPLGSCFCFEPKSLSIVQDQEGKDI